MANESNQGRISGIFEAHGKNPPENYEVAQGQSSCVGKKRKLLGAHHGCKADKLQDDEGSNSIEYTT